MRTILASSLILSTLLLPAVANASKPADDASVATPHVRVTTGVVSPAIEGTLGLAVSNDLIRATVPADAQVGLFLTVDEKGQPQNIHVTRSYDPFWDARVVEAVSKLHFRPGTVDEQPIPVDVNLTVNIQR